MKSYDLTEMETTLKNNNINIDNDSNVLPLSIYQEWFSFIIKDDIQSATEMLLSASGGEKERLVNAPFHYDKSKKYGIYKKSLKRVTLPFHLAVSYGSKRVAELLISNRVNVGTVSEDMDNVLHSCVITSFNRPELEETICDMVDWLVHILPEEETKRLLFQENVDGYYPIEFASQQGCLLILRKLLNTKGHVTFEDNCGLQIYRLHDITDYELGDRHEKSPVGMLAYLDKDILNRPEYITVLLNPLLSGWIDAKIKSNLIPIILWVILRSTFMVAYITFDSGVAWLYPLYGNRSSEYICPELAHIKIGNNRIYLIFYILLYCTFSLSKTVFIKIYRKIHKHHRKSWNLNGKKNLLSSVRFYGGLYFLLIVTLFGLNIMFACMSLAPTLVPFNRNSTAFLVTDIGRTAMPVLMLGTYAFFMQMVPIVGGSIISMQGMISDVVGFLVIFAVVLLPFVVVFESYSLANSLQGCVPEFSNPVITSYTLFKVMMNIYDVSQLKMHNPWILYATHVLFVLLVGIMLLNFLIALMSTSASNISQHEEVHLKINRLAVAITLEETIFSKTKWFYKKLRKSGFLCQGEKVYLQSVVNCFGQFKHNNN